MNRPRAVLLGLLPLALGSCASVDVPVGPDLTAISDVYAEPTGTVDGETIASAAAAALVDLELVHGLGELEFVTDSLQSVSETIHDVAADDENSIRSIRGSANVRTICPGGAAEPTSDPANGDVEYTVAYEQSRLEDTIWGTLTDCVFHDAGARPLSADVEPGPGHYDGTMDIYLGEEVKLTDLDFPSFLFRLDGHARIAAMDTEVGMDFRLLRADSVVEVRAPAADGDVIFGFGSDAARVNLRTRDTTYCCDFDARSCIAVDGDGCDDPSIPGEELTW